MPDDRNGGKPPLDEVLDADAALLWEGMAAQTLQSLPDYRRLLEAAGFRVVSIEDLTVE
jgi:hypothetical protein